MLFLGPYAKFEMVLGWIIFTAISMKNGERRSYFPLRAFLSVAGCLLFKTLLDHIGSSVWHYYLLLVLIIICVQFCFFNTVWQTLLVIGFAYAIQYIMYSLWVILARCFIPGFVFGTSSIYVNLIYYAVLAVMVVVAWVGTRGFRHFTALERFSPPIVILFLVTIFVAGYLCNQINNFSSWSAIVVARLLSSIVCALGMWIAIDFLVTRKIKMNSIIQQHIIERQKEEFELSKENINDLNIKCHDLKYQIREIYSRFEKNDASGLEEIEDCIIAFQNSYNTGSDALNIVLSEQARICAEKEIAFSFSGDGGLLAFMSDMDIYRLFNNAIVNAIEASEKIDIEKRIVSVIIGLSGPFISIYIENYYDGRVEFFNNMPLTSKENKQSHGYGTKSMKAIADSYDAQFSIEYRDEVFSLNFLFPL